MHRPHLFLSRQGRRASLKTLAGFTLIETLVAIALLLVVVVTPYYAADHALIASATARDALLSNSLAQQAVEDVRSMRDGNYISSYQSGSSVDWMTGLDGGSGCFSPNRCVIDTNQASGAVTVTACPLVNGTGNCTTYPLYTQSSGSANYPYFFNQAQQGTATPFIRSIQLFCGSKSQSQSGCNPSTANEVEVVATVQWSSNAQAPVTHTVEVDDYLDNWLASS